MLHIFNRPAMVSVLCFLSGSLCAFGMAPYNIWGVFFIGFGVLYWAVNLASRPRIAFAYGWLWAFGYFVFSLYWIGNALLVEGNPYKWAWPLAVCGLPALLAFFNAIACGLVKRICVLEKWHGYLGFVCILSLLEYARGHVFTGFPWNLYGYTWIDVAPIAQMASLESVYFLTLLTLLWCSVFGFWLATKSIRQSAVLMAFIAVVFVGCFGLGAKLRQDTIYHDDVAVKLIQPNTDQVEKWQRDKMEGHFLNALDLSKVSDGDTALKTLIVWPETVLNPYFLDTPYYRDQIAQMLSEYNGEAILMTGALRREGDVYYNSLLTIDKNGAIERIYNKSHLVPFGEYIPFQKYIPLAPIAQFSGFKEGDGVTSFSLFDTLHYSPLICYEILFPHKIVPKSDHPDFIVNVTNDAWYGDSAGPRQHLVKARFRAIEERIPVLRAANTGISSIIDPYGRDLEHTDIFRASTLSARLPMQANMFFFNPLFSLLLFPFIPLCALIALILHYKTHDKKSD